MGCDDELMMCFGELRRGETRSLDQCGMPDAELQIDTYQLEVLELSVYGTGFGLFVEVIREFCDKAYGSDPTYVL